jgi:hypothetical protein
MVTVFLELILPILVLFIGVVVIRSYRRIDSPSPLAIGCIMPKVCVVGSVEILHFNKKKLDEQLKAKHLLREVLWKQFKVNWGYLCQETWNTTLFQRAVLFELMKIDPTKSALEYNSRETLIAALVDEAAKIRWMLFRAQATLLMRAFFRLSIDQEMFLSVLGYYKKLEEDIVELAGMAEDDCYREMLVERLGLNNWRLISGGFADPA